LINKIFEVLKKEYIEYSCSYNAGCCNFDIDFKPNFKWIKIYNILKCDYIDYKYINDYFSLPPHSVAIFIDNQHKWIISFNNGHGATIISLHSDNFDDLYHIINDDNPIELMQRIQLKNKIRKIG
jgi:hypothetical protein